MPPAHPEHPKLPAVRDRMAAAKHRGKLVAWQYADIREDGLLIAVRCKLCGRPIYGRRPAGDPVVVGKSADGQTVLQVEMEYGPLPDYRQFALQHDDGTVHVTPLCKSCGERAHDAETLEALFLADLEQTAAELAAATPDGADRSAQFLVRHADPTRRQVRLSPLDMTKGR